jgi:hypothetical protein
MLAKTSCRGMLVRRALILLIGFNYSAWLVGAAQSDSEEAYQAERKRVFTLFDDLKYLDALPLFEDLAKKNPKDSGVFWASVHASLTARPRYTRLVPTPRILIERMVIGFALGLALAYACDYLYVRVRMLHPKPDDPFESITAPRLLAISEKGNKTSYELDEQNPTQTVRCVHAIFPHMGDAPCWYLKKKLYQPIPMLMLAPKTPVSFHFSGEI